MGRDEGGDSRRSQPQRAWLSQIQRLKRRFAEVTVFFSFPESLCRAKLLLPQPSGLPSKAWCHSRTSGSALLGSNCPLLLLAEWPWAKYFSLTPEVLLCKIVIMVIPTHGVVEWDNIMHSESTYLLSACCILGTMLGVRDIGESETDQGAGSC